MEQDGHVVSPEPETPVNKPPSRLAEAGGLTRAHAEKLEAVIQASMSDKEAADTEAA